MCAGAHSEGALLQALRRLRKAELVRREMDDDGDGWWSVTKAGVEMAG